MSLRNFVFLILLSALSLQVKAQSSFVFLNDTTRLFFINNNEVYSADKAQLLYFQKGNIFFKGSSDEKQNIYLMTTTMNISGSKPGYIYENDNSYPSFSFSNFKVYSDKAESEEDKAKDELIHIEHAGKWMAFYSSLNDSLLAYYTYDSLPSSAAVFVSYTLIKKFGLDKKLAEQPRVPAFTNQPFATIKPIWGNPTDNEWLWDGKILRPRWNVDARLQWTFDGEVLKPLYSTDTYSQYSWDGEILKPFWRTNRAEEWSWDGKQMKPVWGTDWGDQYVIENGVVKPWSNVHTEKEWRIDGDIPVPVIILVVSGLARRN